MVNGLDMKELNFLSLKNILGRLKKKKTISINVFCYGKKLFYPVYVSNEKFEKYMDLLLIADENKSHYVYIKDFNRFMCNQTKNRNKKHFCKYCLNVLVVREFRQNVKTLFRDKW